MWKYIVGFFAFAGLAIWVMSMGGPVDLSGEHAAQEAMHKEAPAAPAEVAPAATPVAAPAAPAAEAAPAAPAKP